MAKFEKQNIIFIVVIVTILADAAQSQSPKCWHCVDKVTPGCEPFDAELLGPDRLYSCNSKKCVTAVSKSLIDADYHVIRSCMPDKITSEEACSLHTNEGVCKICDTDGCNNGPKLDPSSRPARTDEPNKGANSHPTGNVGKNQDSTEKTAVTEAATEA